MPIGKGSITQLTSFIRINPYTLRQYLSFLETPNYIEMFHFFQNSRSVKRSASSWFSFVRRQILNPEFLHHTFVEALAETGVTPKPRLFFISSYYILVLWLNDGVGLAEIPFNRIPQQPRKYNTSSKNSQENRWKMGLFSFSFCYWFYWLGGEFPPTS